MYHSITFGDLAVKNDNGLTQSYIEGRNTWKDWDLIPSDRPSVSAPAPNKKMIAIPGTNGALDMSTVLTGYMTYQNRTGSWNFIVANRSIDTSPYPPEGKFTHWANNYTNIMNYIHGKSMKCVLEDDPEYYYQGIFAVESWNTNKSYSNITINYDLQPFKRLISASDEPWLWDPFNFETGIIRSIGAYDRDNNTWNNQYDINTPYTTMTIYRCEAPVDLDIVASGKIALHINYGDAIQLVQGLNTIRNIRLLNTENNFQFSPESSHETVIIKYRAGEF